MRRTVAALLLAAAAGLTGHIVTGQTPQRPARDAAAVVIEPTGTATLGGTIVDTDQHPVRRATVSIEGDMDVLRTTVTDDAGHFAFTALPAGRFTITANKGGYPAVAYGAKRPGRPGAGVLLADGQSVTDLIITLARGAVITGTVLDEHGRPMPGVGLDIWDVRTSITGERTTGSGGSTSRRIWSDDRGVYRFYGLPPGEYAIVTAGFASVDDARIPTDEEIREAFRAQTTPSGVGPGAAPTVAKPAPRWGYARVYYPSATDLQAATTVAVRAGEVRDDIDLRMQFMPLSHVEGTVTMADGSQAAGIRVRLVGHHQGDPGWVQGTDATGRFSTVSVPPGDYTIGATDSNGGTAAGRWALAEITVSGADPVHVALSLQPTLTLRGRLAFDGSLAPPDPTKVVLSMNPTDPRRAPQANPTGQSDASGTFSISGLTPGRFVLRARVPGSAPAGAPTWTLASVVIGGEELVDRPIEIGTSAAGEMTMTFTDAVTSLSGRFIAPAGERASDYFVVVLPEDHTYWLQNSRRILSTRPDHDGRYLFDRLPPGAYRVAATTDLTDDDLQDLDALAALAAQSVPIPLAKGERKTFDFKAGGSRP